MAGASVRFDATDGTPLHGWVFPARGERRGAAIYLHGNAGNVTSWWKGFREYESAPRMHGYQADISRSYVVGEPPAEVRTYSNDSYSVEYPRSWLIAEDDVLRTSFRRTRIEAPDGSAVHVAVGEYREIERPSRLVFTWSWLPEGEADPVSGAETLITVELHEEGDATRVVMIHAGFPTDGERDQHQEGWASALERLPGVVETA